MKKIILSILALGMLAGTGWSQLRIVTRPAMPPRDVLERLSLTAGWKIRIPLDGERDGIFSFQIIPGKGGANQLVVQTLKGLVILLDAETGDTIWQIQPSTAYWPGQPVGYNRDNIFVTRREFLYILNRFTGDHRLYTLDPDSQLPIYGYKLNFAPSAAAAADEDMLYFSLSNRLTALIIPDFERSDKIKQPKGNAPPPEKTASLQPKLAWSYLTTDLNSEHPPLLAGSQLVFAATSGDITFLNKYTGEERKPGFRTRGTIAAPPGQYMSSGYVGSEDNTLYALNLENQRLLWRHLSAGPILTQPHANDKDVFVSSDRVGMYRVDRDSGREKWLNKQAESFLAANNKLVYALSPAGHLLILDYIKGSTLANYDMREWNIHLANELNDRIYLAAHDGQVLCLHHRDLVTPLTMKTLEKKTPPKKVDPKKEEPKDKEEPKEKEPKEKDPEKNRGKDKDLDKVGLGQFHQLREVTHLEARIGYPFPVRGGQLKAPARPKS